VQNEKKRFPKRHNHAAPYSSPHQALFSKKSKEKLSLVRKYLLQESFRSKLQFTSSLKVT